MILPKKISNEETSAILDCSSFIETGDEKAY